MKPYDVVNAPFLLWQRETLSLKAGALKSSILVATTRQLLLKLTHRIAMTRRVLNSINNQNQAGIEQKQVLISLRLENDKENPISITPNGSFGEILLNV